MSASQTPSPGQTPGQTPNGALPPFMRRRKQPTNPLVRPKKTPQHRPVPRPLSAVPGVKGMVGVNGTQGIHGAASQVMRPPQNTSLSGISGLSEAPEEFVEYPIITTKREMLEGFRHHVMRFLPNASAAVQHVDPTDQKQFIRPLKLHRRDPRAETSMRWKNGSTGIVGDDAKGNVMDDKERERLDVLRAERRAEREANQAQIAPVTKNAPATKGKHFQKKTEQVFQVNDTGGKKKALQLRYEEALPWHVEDFKEDEDQRNTWAGAYESALSDCHVMLIPEGTPDSTYFRMVPVEKWYKFTPKNQFKALSIDEAEARMSKKVKDPRWFMETQRASEQVKKEASARQSGPKLFTRTGERGERRIKSEVNEGDEEKPEVVADADDIDYNYEEAFADDEENALFGGDEEENKEAEEKIKREQREANIFELKEEKDYDKEEEDEKKKAQKEKKLSKRTQKALMKREKNYVYESDTDENPYSSESESEDSETERLKEEERKKAEEQQQEKGKASTSDKPPSATSSVKGTNTPPRSKLTDPIRKGILKRPGSPNLSEASGSESSRKKLKKKHMSSHSTDPASSLGAPISRPHSPVAGAPSVTSSSNRPSIPSRPASVIPTSSRTTAGSGSDGELSDGARQTKKLKVRLGPSSRPTSPNGSRAASPAPQKPGSVRGGPSATAADPTTTALAPLPSNEEIRSRIPPGGIPLSQLIQAFSPGVMKHPEFISLVKSNSRWDRATKILYPKT